MRNSVIKIISILLIIGLNWAGLSAIIETVAYFFDNEDSNANTFTASTLDFSLSSGGGFSPNVTPTQSSGRTIGVVKNGILGFQYTVQTANISGTLCNNLNLEANLDGGGVEYPAGPLSGLNYNAGQFAAPEDWQFTATLTSNSPALQGQGCTFDFVFDGAQIGGTGFTDTEIIQNTVWAGYWEPPVVLNEILPNPSGDECSLTGINGEWVEIYNKTSNPLDLNNWYIKNSIGTQITISASNTLGGSTTISANGWLVVFMDGCILDNSGDTVTLYDQNDIQADSYTYTAPDHNVNNTPGSTNDMALYLPFDNDLFDQSGNGNNGTNNGATSVDGKINQGLSFDGDDNVVVSGASSLNPSKVTLEAWVRNSGTPGAYKYIAGKHYSGSYASYALYTGSSGGLRFYIGRSGGFVLSPAVGTEIWDGSWHHIVGTYDGAKVRLYVDGTEIGSGTATAVPIAYNSNSLYIGSYGSGFYWKGSIDEVKIYNRDLSAQDVSNHYNAATPSGQVPENKSYARIPDGSSNWVDPIPTPGAPNRLLEEEIIVEGNQIAEEVLITEEVSANEEEITVEGFTEEQSEEQTEEIINEEPTNANEEQSLGEPTEENQEEGTIDKMIDAIVEEILPETEPVDEETSVEETPVIDESTVIEENQTTEETVIGEQPATEEQLVSVPDNDSPQNEPAGVSDDSGDSDGSGSDGTAASADNGSSDSTGDSGDNLSE